MTYFTKFAESNIISSNLIGRIYMKEFIIGRNDASLRLDRFVAKAVPLLPASLIQKYIRLKRVKVNGRGSKGDARLFEGDTVQMYINDEFFEAPSEENAYLTVENPALDIVYEDDNILLINKQPGVLCHWADNDWSSATLIARIQAYLYQKRQWTPRAENSFAPALCNRIDRNTGGIVIAAKNAESLRIMNEKIKNREIEKYYLCVVCGIPKPTANTLTGYIFKDSVKNQVYVRCSPAPGAKTAATKYRTLCSNDGLSLLECQLLTGRTHQIRAQLAAAGYPLLGDGKYGSEKLRREYNEKGQMLWSYKIVFSFTTEAGVLEYLRNREYCVKNVPFVEKYFKGLII